MLGVLLGGSVQFSDGSCNICPVADAIPKGVTHGSPASSPGGLGMWEIEL